MTGDDLTPFPPIDSLCLHVVSLRIPASQRHAGFGVLVLQVLGEDGAGLLIGDFRCVIILIKQVVVVGVPVLIVG